MSGTVIVLSGPPGAGKSTTARGLAATFEKAVHLRTDDFWHYIVSGGIPPYLPGSESQNHIVVDVIVGAACTYAEGGFTVVVDGIVGPWMLDHYEEGRTRYPDLVFHYIVLRPQRAVALDRARRRTGSDALVDEAPILSLWDQFSLLGRYESHAIDTSEHDPSATLGAVSEAIAGGHYVL